MLFEILLTALGLSMDAMAISVCNALCYPNMKPAMRWGLPLAFGVFQGLMPLLGYFAGSIFEGFFTRYAGIVTFLILGVIGANMIREAFQKEEEAACPVLKPTLVLAQAVATSIDAFAVGISFLANRTPIALAASITAAVTFLCCVFALWVGGKFGSKLGKRAQALGGAVLVLLGLKALFF